MEYLRKNLQYLLESRGETRVSLCEQAGVNRTTIYNILDGRVQRVHASTIQKISDFFGISYREIETTDVAEKERCNATVSYDGNMNPCAVPIFTQSECVSAEFFESKIGLLTTGRQLTYYFGFGANIVAILLEYNFSDKYHINDLLIVRRGNYNNDNPKLCFNQKQGKFQINECYINSSEDVIVIGDIMEVRYGNINE
ncbi:MAG: helix-turn-helix transcriptional regulator [Enterobacteriaceae bacterium]|nr:helix-turn-helix transcriptional regulator [Enterobacteriaceae bacterium]